MRSIRPFVSDQPGIFLRRSVTRFESSAVAMRAPFVVTVSVSARSERANRKSRAGNLECVHALDHRRCTWNAALAGEPAECRDARGSRGATPVRGGLCESRAGFQGSHRLPDLEECA